MMSSHLGPDSVLTINHGNRLWCPVLNASLSEIDEGFKTVCGLKMPGISTVRSHHFKYNIIYCYKNGE